MYQSSLEHPTLNFHQSKSTTMFSQKSSQAQSAPQKAASRQWKHISQLINKHVILSTNTFKHRSNDKLTIQRMTRLVNEQSFLLVPFRLIYFESMANEQFINISNTKPISILSSLCTNREHANLLRGDKKERTRMQVEGRFQLMLMEMGLISFNVVEMAVPIRSRASSILFTNAYNLWNEIISFKKTKQTKERIQ